MSCLSCKTNRYLTNIYKSQQRITLSRLDPDCPAWTRPACNPKFCIVRRGSNSNVVEASPPASAGRWVHVGTCKILGGWNMGHGRVQWRPPHPLRVPGEGQALHAALIHSRHVTCPITRAGGATVWGPQPAPPGSPERLHLTVSKSLRLSLAAA